MGTSSHMEDDNEATGLDWFTTNMQDAIARFKIARNVSEVDSDPPMGHPRVGRADSRDLRLLKFTGILRELAELLECKWVDRTPYGGSYWIVGGSELESIVKDFGMRPARNGGDATSYRPAWYWKPPVSWIKA